MIFAAMDVDVKKSRGSARACCGMSYRAERPYEMNHWHLSRGLRRLRRFEQLENKT